MDKNKCPKCGTKLKITERIDNLPAVILSNQPKFISLFKQCEKCKYFFAKWFSREKIKGD